MTYSWFLRGDQRAGSAARARRCGFVLVAFTLALALILGSVGLAFDIGRMYIVKNEAQTFCDAAALAAVMRLDNSSTGIDNARVAALAIPKRWNFGTQPFDTTVPATSVEFAKDIAGPWTTDPGEDPGAAEGYILAKVTTRVSLPMFLVPVVTGTFSASIAASAVAKQSPDVGGGSSPPIFPFVVPYLPEGTGRVVPGAAPQEEVPGDPFNMIPALKPDGTYQHGGVYTLRGPASIDKNKPLDQSLCPNDATPEVANYRTASGTPDRGYLWSSPAASSIDNPILTDIPPADTPEIEVGSPIADACDACKQSGNKQSDIWDVIARVGGRDSPPPAVVGDADPTTQWYMDYIAKINRGDTDAGSYRRVVHVPIATWNCSQFADCPSVNKVVGFAAFFLLPTTTSSKKGTGKSYDFYGTGDDPLCAEYIGPWTPNMGGTGGGSGPGSDTYPILVR